MTLTEKYIQNNLKKDFWVLPSEAIATTCYIAALEAQMNYIQSKINKLEEAKKTEKSKDVVMLINSVLLMFQADLLAITTDLATIRKENNL